MSDDLLQKFLFENVPVKGSLVRLSTSWSEVLHRARPNRPARDMLGQALCAAALLTSNIKFKGSVSLQIQSSASFRLLSGQCSHDGRVRGIARMYDETDDATGQQAVLAINLEPDEEGSPYQGIVALENENLVTALEQYFLQSEQLDTRFWLVANESTCSGLMLQRMPGQSFDPDDWTRITQLAATLSPQELCSLEPEKLIRLLFSDDSVRLFSPLTMQFACKCSKQRVSNVLYSLGEEEIKGLIEERGSVDVDCRFCGQDYRFDSVDVAAIFNQLAVSPQDSAEVH